MQARLVPAAPLAAYARYAGVSATRPTRDSTMARFVLLIFTGFLSFGMVWYMNQI
jgi:hypothetical protein